MMPSPLSVVVLATYPSEDASRRLRIDPLVQALEGRGPVSVHTLLPGWAFRKKNAGRFWKAVVGLRLVVALVARVAVILRLKGTDLVIVHREAFPFFTPHFERLVQRRSRMTVIDVDDAIHQAPTHRRDWRNVARHPQRALEYIGMADLVFAGSPSMVQIASEAGASNVVFAPTCPPAAAHSLDIDRERDRILIWTGSQSTLGSLEEILESTLTFCERSDYRLVVLGGQNVSTLAPHPRLIAERWTPQRELSFLSRADFGLMPLPDTPWERGKSSYKALLYMASGVIPVVSPIGMNAWLASAAPAVITLDQGSLVHTFERADLDAASSRALRVRNREWVRRHAFPDVVTETQLSHLGVL